MWAQVVNFILGLWLMAAPSVLGYAGTAADSNHIVGPVIATFAMIAWWECTRSVRLWNVPLGAWLIVAPWVLAYDDNQILLNDSAVGALVIFFSFFKGKVEGVYGGGWSSLWTPDSLHEKTARNSKDKHDPRL